MFFDVCKNPIFYYIAQNTFKFHDIIKNITCNLLKIKLVSQFFLITFKKLWTDLT